MAEVGAAAVSRYHAFQAEPKPVSRRPGGVWAYEMQLMRLILPHEPGVVFEEIRRRWSKPALDEGRGAEWAKINRAPMKYLASQALPPEDQGIAYSLGGPLRSFAVTDATRAEAPFRYLKHVIGAFPPVVEVPDAWLSALISSLQGLPEEARRASAHVRGFAEAIIARPEISDRVRFQARLLIVQKAEDFWQLMDFIGAGETPEEAGRIIAAYLDGNRLSETELKLLLSTLSMKLLGKRGAADEMFEMIAWHATDSSAAMAFVSDVLILTANEPDQVGNWVPIAQGLSHCRLGMASRRDYDTMGMVDMPRSSLGSPEDAWLKLWRRTASDSSLSEFDRDVLRLRLAALAYRLPGGPATAFRLFEELIPALEVVSPRLLSGILREARVAAPETIASLGPVIKTVLEAAILRCEEFAKAPMPEQFGDRRVYQTISIGVLLGTLGYPDLDKRVRDRILAVSESISRDRDAWVEATPLGTRDGTARLLAHAIALYEAYK